MSSRRGWTVTLAGPAARDLERLPAKVLHAVIDLFTALEAHPARLGKPLRFDLEGLFVVRRGPFRVIYEIDDEQPAVLVIAVGHRADVYRRR